MNSGRAGMKQLVNEQAGVKQQAQKQGRSGQQTQEQEGESQQTHKQVGASQRAYALAAGSSLIVMAVAAAFSYGYVHSSLVVADDASTTLDNIISAQGLFKAEIFGWFIILMCDIVCAWAMYLYMKSINRSLSLLGGWLRLSYAMILAVAISNLIDVSLLTSSSPYSTLWSTDQLQASVMQGLNAFEAVWSLGLIIFGGHLLVIGIIAFQSKFIPKIISILLLIAAIGYLIVHTGDSFLGQYAEIISVLEMILIVPMTIGELGFGLWLLFRGGKQKSEA